MKSMTKDTPSVSFSLSFYRLLLYAYPAEFRREYGLHMAQVFRDSCLAAERQDGLPGMLLLWIHTLVDFLISVFNEHSQKEILMTKDKLTRLSGWGMILGTLLFVLGFALDASQVRLFIYRTIGLPETAAQYNLSRAFADHVGVVIALLGVALITFGILGLQLRYGKQVSRFGETSLWVSVIGGVVAIIAMIGFFFFDSWNAFVVGMLSQQLFLGLFGIAALQAKPFPRWNGLPLLAGILPVVVIVSLILNELNVVELADEGIYLLIPWLIGLVLLGYTMQTEPVVEEKIAVA
jgi:hypothetical protein